MKKEFAFLFILIISISFVSAIWWNPFTWFEKKQVLLSSTSGTPASPLSINDAIASCSGPCSLSGDEIEARTGNRGSLYVEGSNYLSWCVNGYGTSRSKGKPPKSVKLGCICRYNDTSEYNNDPAHTRKEGYLDFMADGSTADCDYDNVLLGDTPNDCDDDMSDYPDTQMDPDSPKISCPTDTSGCNDANFECAICKQEWKIIYFDNDEDQYTDKMANLCVGGYQPSIYKSAPSSPPDCEDGNKDIKPGINENCNNNIDDNCNNFTGGFDWLYYTGVDCDDEKCLNLNYKTEPWNPGEACNLNNADMKCCFREGYGHCSNLVKVYRDKDGDTWGDDNNVDYICPGTTKPGYVFVGGDCDDDPAKCGAGCNPGVEKETCDDKTEYDEDCDYMTNCRDFRDCAAGGPFYATAPNWALGAKCEIPGGYCCNDRCDLPLERYKDEDKDGEGVCTKELFCAEKPGYVATPGDCYDKNPDIKMGKCGLLNSPEECSKCDTSGDCIFTPDDTCNPEDDGDCKKCSGSIMMPDLTDTNVPECKECKLITELLKSYGEAVPKPDESLCGYGSPPSGPGPAPSFSPSSSISASANKIDIGDIGGGSHPSFLIPRCCSGECVDEAFDDFNCGSCGNVCGCGKKCETSSIGSGKPYCADETLADLTGDYPRLGDVANSLMNSGCPEPAGGWLNYLKSPLAQMVINSLTTYLMSERKVLEVSYCVKDLPCEYDFCFKFYYDMKCTPDKIYPPATNQCVPSGATVGDIWRGGGSGPLPPIPTPTSCLPKGTKIEMADGTEKNIEDIKLGEKVKSYSNNQIVYSRVLDRENPIRDSMCTIIFEDNSELKLTEDHAIYTKDGPKAINPEKAMESHYSQENIKQLSNKDLILSSDLNYKKIKEIKKCETGKFQSYNLILGNNKNYFAGGNLVYS